MVMFVVLAVVVGTIAKGGGQTSVMCGCIEKQIDFTFKCKINKQLNEQPNKHFIFISSYLPNEGVLLLFCKFYFFPSVWGFNFWDSFNNLTKTKMTKNKT